MSEPTSTPEAPAPSATTVIDRPQEQASPENGSTKSATPAEARSSVPSPVLPPKDGVVALNGTKVATTTREAAAAAPPVAPPPPASATRAGEGVRAPAPPALPQRSAGTSLGPVGKRRPVIAVVLLSIVTLGVYALVWHQRVNREVGDFDPRMHVRPGVSTIAVTIPWALAVLVTLAAAARIVVAITNITLPFNPHVTVLQAYALLGTLLLVPYAELLLPFSAVAAVMTLERVRTVEDRVGITTDVQLRPCAVLCVMFVPVIGGLVVLAIAQHRLNRVWQMAAATQARVTRL